LIRCQFLLRSRKGLHPISAVIFLIAILLVLMGIISLWAMMKERAGHAIQIQSVTFEESRIRIYVQNVGRGTVILESVHINDEKMNVYGSNNQEYSEIMIKVGQTTEIIINHAYKEKVKIKITCKDGTFIEAEWGP